MTLTEIPSVGGLVVVVAGIDPTTGKVYALPVNGSTGELLTSGSGGSGGSLSAEHNTILPTLADGDTAALQLDDKAKLIVTLGTLLAGEDLTNNILGIINKPVNSSSYASSSDVGFGTVTKKTAKGTPGSVHSFFAANRNSAGRFFQLHNKATAPVATEVPQLSFWVPPASILTITEAFFAALEYFSSGISWAWSTTDGTFTDSATAGEHSNTIKFT